VERDLSDGHHENPTDRLDYFTTAYFHRPEDLRREVAGAGFTVDGLYGVEGPGWILPDFVERWNDPARREILLQVARALESEPAILGCSAHLLVVGQAEQRTRASPQRTLNVGRAPNRLSLRIAAPEGQRLRRLDWSLLASEHSVSFR
jgi:hypothetical protein